MRKLVIYITLAMLTVAAAGCGRNWSSWFCRGEMCDTCDTTPVYSSDYMPAMDSLPETLPPMRN